MLKNEKRRHQEQDGGAEEVLDVKPDSASSRGTRQVSSDNASSTDHNVRKKSSLGEDEEEDDASLAKRRPSRIVKPNSKYNNDQNAAPSPLGRIKRARLSTSQNETEPATTAPPVPTTTAPTTTASNTTTITTTPTFTTTTPVTTTTTTTTTASTPPSTTTAINNESLPSTPQVAPSPLSPPINPSEKEKTTTYFNDDSNKLNRTSVISPSLKLTVNGKVRGRPRKYFKTELGDTPGDSGSRSVSRNSSSSLNAANGNSFQKTVTTVNSDRPTYGNAAHYSIRFQRGERTSITPATNNMSARSISTLSNGDSVPRPGTISSSGARIGRPPKFSTRGMSGTPRIPRQTRIGRPSAASLTELNQQQAEDLNKANAEIAQLKSRVEELISELEALKRQCSYTGQTVPKIDYDRLIEKHKVELREAKKREWCIFCGEPSRYYCCWNTTYCSTDCQVNDWYKRHKSYCARLRKKAEAVQST